MCSDPVAPAATGGLQYCWAFLPGKLIVPTLSRHAPMLQRNTNRADPSRVAQEL